MLELEANEEASGYDGEECEENISDLEKSPAAWKSRFKEQMQQIIHLWDVCHVSIIHRTQFYLLFRGDPADQIYIEVEVRRLTWLQEHFDEVGSASPAPMGDDPISLSSRCRQFEHALLLQHNMFSSLQFFQTFINTGHVTCDPGLIAGFSLRCSIKALRHEREFLAKRLQSRLTEDERERLYIKWQVPLEGKQRKLQLVSKLWTDPNDAAHIEESADIVARLVGFCEGGNNIAKEMFELNFALPASKKPWLLGWQPISNLLRL